MPKVLLYSAEVVDGGELVQVAKVAANVTKKKKRFEEMAVSFFVVPMVLAFFLLFCFFGGYLPYFIDVLPCGSFSSRRLRPGDRSTAYTGSPGTANTVVWRCAIVAAAAVKARLPTPHQRRPRFRSDCAAFISTLRMLHQSVFSQSRDLYA